MEVIMENQRISIQDYRALSSAWQCSSDKLEKVTTEDLKKLLADYVLSEKAKRAIIDELKRREPDFSYDSVNPLQALADEDKVYPALSTIAIIFKLFGWLLIIAGVLVVILISKEMAIMGILALLVALFFALLSFAVAEGIFVITDISSLAYRILKHISDK